MKKLKSGSKRKGEETGLAVESRRRLRQNLAKGWEFEAGNPTFVFLSKKAAYQLDFR